ncbi:unnamed protein product [Orchesella dallaii]|uniref:Asparagine synthetase domain-containing protein 1 n=1 Tax=Orchesella dallaii TaxID=48710 RepID=A0ABP1R4E7_9HEXA
MCGIWCCICSGNQKDLDSSPCFACTGACEDNIFNRQQEFVSRRGPDIASSRCFKYKRNIGPNLQASGDEESLPFNIHLSTNVLWTQGEDIISQPYSNADESKLMLFNGDIYSFQGAVENTSEDANNFKNSKNDGITLFSLLENCKNAQEKCAILGNLQGPYAFIYIDLLEEQLWFARDFFGRESLLFSYDCNFECDNMRIIWNLSSVSVFKNVFEVPASGLFCVEMKTKELKLFPYSHDRSSVSDLQLDFFAILKSSGFVNNIHVSQETIIDLHFSSRLKPQDSIDNAAEETDTLHHLMNLAKRSASANDFIKDSVGVLSNDIDLFLKTLRHSVQRRVSTLPPYCKNCMLLRHANSDVICSHSKVGVLFSGGLDSTVLAYLTAEASAVGSTVDLITVAFSKDDNFNAPDRETALASYKMLKERFHAQGKTINLVIVNVSKPEVEEKRLERVRDLISPLKSVLDDSIGMCLWFAARGAGYLFDDSARNPYTTPVRIMLLGSGADELLGGYGRHRSAYEKSGWLGLRNEMQLEIDRISIRNLGRDNRIVSDHGICPRMPFLDEHVVDFLTSSCDIWVKCCPVNTGSLGRGSGEKLLLRALAAKLFGDEYLSLALFPKRAMQFGSRIAKLENSKEKGGDSCHRLL